MKLTEQTRLSYLLDIHYHEIITIKPSKRSGKPCIREMRITVQDVLEYLASGMTEAEILADSPVTTFAPTLRSPTMNGSFSLWWREASPR